MTPREAAKSLIAEGVRRGVRDKHAPEAIIHDLQEGQYGHCGHDYWAEINGYSQVIGGKPRKMRPWELIVKDIGCVPCEQIFDVRELVKEVYSELTQRSVQQRSLWDSH